MIDADLDILECPGAMREHDGDLLDLTPEADLPTESTCRNCGRQFTPRRGGKPQAFCSPGCRKAHHSGGNSNVSNVSNVSTLQTGRPGTQQPADAENASEGFAGETLLNPNSKIGSYVDHRDQGGPLLLIPEEDLRKIDRISEEMRIEEELDPKIDLDWAVDKDVIIRKQCAIAVYLNQEGSVTIREEAGYLDTDDKMIVVQPEYLGPLIDRLCELAGIGSAGRRD